MFLLALAGVSAALLLLPQRSDRFDQLLLPPPATDPVNHFLGRDLALIRADGRVPRKLYRHLPAGMADIPAGSQRKDKFIACLLPLIVRMNEDLEADRGQMLALIDRLEAGRHISKRQMAWLDDKLKWLRVSDAEPGEVDRALVERRMRAIPVSLALAQAAIESGWGSSRFAREGNALYGQWTWDDDAAGIVPTQRVQGATHRIKAFDSLLGSVRAYARNLNSGSAYQRFRRLRAEDHSVYEMAATLTRYSERGQAYVDDLVTIIRSNRLTDFDKAILVDPALS